MPSFLTIEAALKVAVTLGGLMTAAAYLVLVERWMAAWIQDRWGPNRVGIPLTKIRLFGLGQPLADGIKFIFKENYTPAHVDKALFLIAPIVILAAALAVFAVVPFGSVLPSTASVAGVIAEEDVKEVLEATLAQRSAGETITDADVLAAHPEMEEQLAAALPQIRPIPLVIAPGLDVGIIYVFALSSIAVYGVILGGWASNNKYSFLGALRSSAQLIAYELPLGLGILGVVLATGTLRLDRIIDMQADSGLWLAFSQPLGMLVFIVASFAEAARLPFDLPECEQELVGGYHTEYSGMKLLLFLVAEFLHMITAAFLIVILFLGGWHFWGITGEGVAISWLTALLRVGVLMGKMLAVVLFFMLVRWSWPRFRFDQLMSLAWKVMLPLGLVNLVAVALIQEAGRLGDGTILGIPSSAAAIVVGWVVLFGSWAVVAYAGPLVTDNRPRHDVRPFEIDPQT